MLKSRELGGHEIDVEGNFETSKCLEQIDTTTLMYFL